MLHLTATMAVGDAFDAMAAEMVRFKLQEGSARDGAIAFDVDDTALLGDRPSPLVLALQRLASELGFAIVFVTAREDADDIERLTRQQLGAAGYAAPFVLALTPAAQRTTLRGVGEFKRAARARLASAPLLFMVGDQFFDVAVDPTAQLREVPPSGMAGVYIEDGCPTWLVKIPDARGGHTLPP